MNCATCQVPIPLGAEYASPPVKVTMIWRSASPWRSWPGVSRMARKRTAEHRAAHDNTRESDRNPHAGLDPSDLSEQTRPRSPEDPTAELPASVEAERGRYAGPGRGARGLPESDRPFAAKPIDRLAAEPPPRPEYREGPPEGDRE